MPDPDRDAQPEERTDVRFDAWPIHRHQGHERADNDVHETPREHDDTVGAEPEDLSRREDSEVEWIGLTGYPGSPTAYVYDRDETAVYEAELDEENQRVLVDESERREVEDDESLAEHIERIGDEHGWNWLSSIAGDFVDEDRHDDLLAEGGTSGRPLELEESEFQRKNVLDDADHDLAFFGSHTYRDPTDRVHVLERRFEVYVPETGGVPDVEVEDRFLVADDPQAERRAGDATMIDKRVYGIDVDVDASADLWKAELEEELEAYHENNVEWPEPQAAAP